MSDIFDDKQDNEDLEFANKEWIKLNKSLQKDGFKDGKHEGRDDGLQKAFNVGYTLAFDPFLLISSFEAIIDVLAKTAAKTIKSDDKMFTTLTTMKTNIRQLYQLIENNLLSLEINNKLESKTVHKIVLNKEVNHLFDLTKQLAINTCNENTNFEPLLHLIKDLTLDDFNNQ